MPSDDILKSIVAVSGIAAALVGAVVAGVFGLWMKRRDASLARELEGVKAEFSTKLEKARRDRGGPEVTGDETAHRCRDLTATS